MLNRRDLLQGIGLLGLSLLSPKLLSANAFSQQSITALSFNIWYGGEKGNQPLQSTADVILASKAKIVGIQELKQSGPELSKLTGLNFVEQKPEKTGILSAYPLLEMSPEKTGGRFKLPNGQSFWFFNVHLFHAPYQPYQLAGIPYRREDRFVETAGEAIAEAIRARGVELADLLTDMAVALRSDLPILVTGDFNEPSHLDWTVRAAEAGKCQMPVAWPTSRAMVDAGFTDAYRAMFADEVSHPGNTWTPVPSPRDLMDRIDFVYSRNCRPVSAAIVGESQAAADIVVSPYPSDHRAVVATVEF